MEPTPPIVFMSHASEDKATVAEPLARALLARGVDVWLDKWEIGPGDSLVQKIFEQGLAGAEGMVVVLSTNSVQKPWVRAELDNAVVRRIEGALRLMPVLADDCQVPESLRATLWMDVRKDGVGAVADRIAAKLHGASEKPQLGPRPRYLDQVRFRIKGVSESDAAVLDLLYKQALENGSPSFVQLAEIEEAAADLGISGEGLIEAAEMLASSGHVVGDQYGVDVLNIPPRSFLALAKHHGEDVDLARRRLVAKVLNEDQADVWGISDSIGISRALGESLADALEQNGMLSQIKPCGGSTAIHSPTTALRRWLQEQP